MCVITDARPSYDKKKLYLYEIVIKVAQSFENVPPLSTAVGNVRFFIVKIRVIISLVTSALTKKNVQKAMENYGRFFLMMFTKALSRFYFAVRTRVGSIDLCDLFYCILYCATRLKFCFWPKMAGKRVHVWCLFFFQTLNPFG